MLHRNQFACVRNSSRAVIAILYVVFVSALVAMRASAQTPTPTPITKPDPPTVQTPSTVGKIPKWTGANKNGIGVIGDSIMTESGGNLGIDVTNPTDKLTVGGGINATGVINAGTHFSIGGNRAIVLDVAKFNLFAGYQAGSAATTGDRNTFFGNSAGVVNNTGTGNSFFGFLSGRSNTSGAANSFFGLQAGVSNTTGSNNAFFGAVSGNLNTSGEANSFFGISSGYNNTTGNFNAFFGGSAGGNNRLGSYNSFFGTQAGLSNTNESYNTFIGVNTNGTTGITNATALGANAVVTQSNSVVIGNNANVGIGTSAPQAKLHAVGSSAGRFDGNVTINGDISVSGAANLNAATADLAKSLAPNAPVNGNQVNGALANATIAGNAITGDVSATQVSGNLVNATMSGNNITNGTVVKGLNGLTDNVTLAAGNNISITPSGNTLTISADTATPTTSLNPNQVALMRWYPANKSGVTFTTGNGPSGVVFDGSSIWVANYADNSVTKLRPGDGQVLATFPTGPNPAWMGFDGANIWVANTGNGTASKLRASDGQLLATIPVGQNPAAFAFDGESIWVSAHDENRVTKLRVSDGAVLGSVSLERPTGLAFDGTNVWVAHNRPSGGVTKIAAAGPVSILATYGTGQSFTYNVAFDGTNLGGKFRRQQRHQASCFGWRQSGNFLNWIRYGWNNI